MGLSSALDEEMIDPERGELLKDQLEHKAPLRIEGDLPAANSLLFECSTRICRGLRSMEEDCTRAYEWKRGGEL